MSHFIRVLIVFVLTSISLAGQTPYHRFLDSTGWNIHAESWSYLSNTWYYQSGTTIIGPNTYANYNGFLLREDSTQRKVYIYDTLLNADRVLYDFNLQVGDSFYVHANGWINEYMHVYQVDSVLTYVGYRKQIKLSGSTYYLRFIEGIGSPQDPIGYMTPNIIDPSPWMTCFYQHGQPIFSNNSICPDYLQTMGVYITPSTCGQCNGSVYIFTTFMPDTMWWISDPNYNWTPHGPMMLTDLCPYTSGTFQIVSNANAINQTDLYYIPNSTATNIQNSSAVQASCSNCCDGSITEIVQSGTPPYTYVWSPNISTTNTASGLCPGTYIVTVTDSLGCTDADTVVISFSTEITTLHYEPPQIVQWEVYDLSGKLLLTTESKERSSFSILAPGLYLLRAITKEGEVLNTQRLLWLGT